MGLRGSSSFKSEAVKDEKREETKSDDMLI